MAWGVRAAAATVLVAALAPLLFGGGVWQGAAAQQRVGQPSFIRTSGCRLKHLFQQAAFGALVMGLRLLHTTNTSRPS